MSHHHIHTHDSNQNQNQKYKFTIPNYNEDEIIPGSPKKFGPGTWWILHLMAYHVVDKSQINDFVKFVHYIAANIPCPTCRGHAAEYLEDNDGSRYVNMTENGRNVGMFVWMSDFHNEVNKKHRKPIINWRDAFAEYDSKHREWDTYQMPGPIV